MRQSMPRVSVGMPVYNGEQFVENAITSIMSQTFRDIELVISDNCSSDGTEEICRRHAANDSRIRYVRSDVNRGGAWNRNNVFNLSSGTYFMWHDHDDMSAPTLIESCVSVLDSHDDVVGCHANTTIIDENGDNIRDYVEHLHLMSDSPCDRYKKYNIHDRDCPLCSIYFGLFRRNVLDKTRLILPFVNSEANLMSELALRGKFFELPEHLFFRRDHPGISTRKYTTHAERMAWFDPAKRGKGGHPGWKMLAEQFRSVTRVNMSGNDKACCYFFVGQFFIWLARGSLRNMRADLWQRFGHGQGSLDMDMIGPDLSTPGNRGKKRRTV